MKRAILAVALLTSTSGIAAAGPYGGFGVGTAPEISNQYGTYGKDGRSVRLFGGYRYRQFAAEALFTLYDVSNDVPQSISAKHAALAGRYNLGLGSGFELFGRLGLQKTWLTADDPSDMSGGGGIIGVGAQYEFKAGPIPRANVFVDYNILWGNLTSTVGNEYDVTTRVWTMGLTAGF